MTARLQFAGNVLPERIITGVFALIEHLAPDDVLCHSDLHPGNVIMKAQGPRLIDCLGAARAPAAYEIAQCHVLMSELDENATTIQREPRPRAHRPGPPCDP